MKAAFLICASALASPSIALSESDEGFGFVNTDQTLGFVTFAEISVNDSVTGGCWTNVESVEARIRLLFEQNDIETLEGAAFNGPSAPYIYISALGLKNGNLCAVSAEFSVFAQGTSYWDASERGGKEWLVAHFSQMYSSQHLFTGPGAVNNEISDWFEGKASDFLAGVLAAKRNPIVNEFKSDFPGFFDKPDPLSSSVND